MSKARADNRKKKGVTKNKKIATKQTKVVADPFEAIEKALALHGTNSNYLLLNPGERAKIHIDTAQGQSDETKNNPRPVETDSFDKKYKVLKVLIILTDTRDHKVKKFTCAKRDFAVLLSFLRKGHKDFEIRRTGTGLSTRYAFIPV
jgi:hypothetical protein